MTRDLRNSDGAPGVAGCVTEHGELSPTDWVREQTQRILEQGTTDGVEVLDRPIVLFTTTGAKSGKKRYVPLMRVEENGRYAMVASKGGAPEHPSWYFNLTAHPDCEFGGEPFTATEVTDPQEYARLFALAEKVYSGYDDYREKTADSGRQIPIMRLTPR